MAQQLLGVLNNFVKVATRPPPPIVDRTLPEQNITKDNLDENIILAKKFYYMDKPNDFHVAVIGGKGVGKSSLINALCTWRDDQAGAAPVGVGNSEPKAYRNPMAEGLVLWEMPGAGVGHPSLTYFYDKKLYAFDLLLLVSDRFHRVDFDVARYGSHFNRRIIFVRTKADLAIHQILEQSKSEGRSKLQLEEAFNTLHKEVEASFREGLRLCGLSDKWSVLQLFIVSAKRYLNGPNVYSMTDDEEEEDDDEGLNKLDEDKLNNYLNTLVRNRAIRRTRTLKQRTFTNKSK
ncbi:hypothetical protein L7F22_017970 [Adiantum nelumboides]|nr:hypothetical protein [Adiantum nelumboides]